MFAQASGGNITNFSNGNAEHTVTVSSRQYSPIGFTLERNTTITSASFLSVQPRQAHHQVLWTSTPMQTAFPSGRSTTPAMEILAINPFSPMTMLR